MISSFSYLCSEIMSVTLRYIWNCWTQTLLLLMSSCYSWWRLDGRFDIVITCGITAITTSSFRSRDMISMHLHIPDPPRKLRIPSFFFLFYSPVACQLSPWSPMRHTPGNQPQCHHRSLPRASWRIRFLSQAFRRLFILLCPYKCMRIRYMCANVCPVWSISIKSLRTDSGFRLFIVPI